MENTETIREITGFEVQYLSGEIGKIEWILDCIQHGKMSKSTACDIILGGFAKSLDRDYSYEDDMFVEYTKRMALEVADFVIAKAKSAATARANGLKNTGRSKKTASTEEMPADSDNCP